MSNNAKPNPGSQEARDQGCICPVIDNCHGRGYRPATEDQPAQFVTRDDCPLHGRAAGSEAEHG